MYPKTKIKPFTQFLADFFAPILKITPQEMALDFDHAYRQHMAYTRENKLPLEIIMKFTGRLIRDAIH